VPHGAADVHLDASNGQDTKYDSCSRLRRALALSAHYRAGWRLEYHGCLENRGAHACRRIAGFEAPVFAGSLASQFAFARGIVAGSLARGGDLVEGCAAPSLLLILRNHDTVAVGIFEIDFDVSPGLIQNVAL
jgi:hypothetical protein